VKCVGAFDGVVLAALCKASNFFGASFFPEEFVVAFEKLFVFFEEAGVGIENSEHVTKRMGGWVDGAFDFVVY
jgi:hypothetical protein